MSDDQAVAPPREERLSRLSVRISPEHRRMLKHLARLWKRKQGASIEHMIEHHYRLEVLEAEEQEVLGGPV